jgi:glycosyltransferase involved in cell wall biosynthesis
MIHYMSSDGVGQAWIANELSVVQKSGIPFVLHAMRKPESTFHRANWAQKLNDNTEAIYPLPLLGTLMSIFVAPFLFDRRFFASLLNALIGKRENLRARVACLVHFFVACHWARLHRQESISHIHSQWAYSCCSIAMYAAWLLNKPFSFTGHGADLWRDRVALEDKIRRAEFIICISKFHRDLYLKHGAHPKQLHIVYCGIDVHQFSPPSEHDRPSDGIIHIRSSGRLVDKKGFIYLIEACSILANREVAFECTIAGSGPLENELRDAIDRLGIEDRVTVTGEELKQEDIAAFAHGGTVYCLPCVWGKDNDADGLPQMLMETMASGLPAISTRLVGIPDLIIDEETGILVEPNDAVQIANAIERIAGDYDLARRLAKAGRDHIIQHFELENALKPLIDLYRQQLDAAVLRNTSKTT